MGRRGPIKGCFGNFLLTPSDGDAKPGGPLCSARSQPASPPGELWRHVAAAEAMSQHPTCLGGPANPQGCSSPWVNINHLGGPQANPGSGAWRPRVGGWGSLEPRVLLTWPFRLLSFPLLKFIFSLPAAQVFEWNAAAGLTHTGEGPESHSAFVNFPKGFGTGDSALFCGSLDGRGFWGRTDTCTCMTSWRPRGEEFTCSAGDSGLTLGREDPGRRKWQPTPVFLPGESHVSLWATVHGAAEAPDTTERPSTALHLGVADSFGFTGNSHNMASGLYPRTKSQV